MTAESDTPRTDAETLLTCPSAHFDADEGVPMVPFEFARTLERETVELANTVLDLERKLADASKAYAATSGQYMDLLYAVAKSHPGESRHETAKRYILNAERGSDAASAALSAEDRHDD